MKKYANIQFISLFETIKTPTMRNNPKGEWVRDGPKEESVTEESATLGCENEHRIAVNEDRRNMARITENSRHLHSLIAAMQRCLKRPDASSE